MAVTACPLQGTAPATAAASTPRRAPPVCMCARVFSCVCVRADVHRGLTLVPPLRQRPPPLSHPAHPKQQEASLLRLSQPSRRPPYTPARPLFLPSGIVSHPQHHPLTGPPARLAAHLERHHPRRRHRPPPRRRRQQRRPTVLIAATAAAAAGRQHAGVGGHEANGRHVPDERQRQARCRRRAQALPRRRREERGGYGGMQVAGRLEFDRRDGRRAAHE